MNLLEEIRQKSGLPTLNEATYNLSSLNPVKDLIRKKWKTGVGVYSLTEYFKPWIKNEELKVGLYFPALFDKRKDDRELGYTFDNKNYVMILIKRKLLKEMYGEDSVEKAIEIFEHEVIHAIDYIRSIKKDDDKKSLEVKITVSKDKLGKTKGKGFPESYAGNVYEFNRMINFLADQKKQNSEWWKSYNKLENSTQISAGLSNELLNGEAEGLDVLKLMDNKKLQKEIFKRLHREKLLPKNLKNY